MTEQAVPFKDPKLFGTIDKIAGINNVTAEERTQPPFVRTATNFDIDDTGELQAAIGSSNVAVGLWQNLWSDGENFLSVKAGDLVRTATDGTVTVLSAGVGTTTMRYQRLPNGNVVMMNGVSSGTLLAGTDTVRSCGVPIPTSAGSAANTTGNLIAGRYQWQVSYTRDSDGEEGGVKYAEAYVNVTSGGVALTGLPTLAGHTMNVYLTSANDDTMYFAGTTTSTSFVYSEGNEELVLPCKTEFLAPPPVGKFLGFYKGRLLVGVDNVLYASRPFQYELFDLRQDYKQFPANLRFVAGVDTGVFVGTEDGVWFLAGDSFDKLTARQVDEGAALENSDVIVDRSVIGTDDRVGAGLAVVVVVRDAICVGSSDGSWRRVTDGVYELPAGASCSGASYRNVRGISQYVLHV